jgi:M6 family metalloprotease-like protein
MGGVPAQAGTPVGLNQATLVIYVRASDDATANLATLRTTEQAEFNNVTNFFRESSFARLSFAYTHAPAPAAGWYQLTRTYDDYMWTQADITAAGTDAAKVKIATDNQALVQDFTTFFTESLQAANDDGFNVANFTQVVVVIIGPFHRGTSWPTSNFTLQDNSTNPATPLQVSVPVIVVSTNTGWSRTAHEFGHGFGGFADLYGAPNRGMGNWDIMDCTDCTDQTTGWHKDRKAQWFQGSQLLVLPRPTGTGRVDQTVNLVPLETETPAAGAVQSVRLDVGGSMYLYVENRQTLTGQTGSRQLPANAVIITDGDDNAQGPNTGRPPVLLFGGPNSSNSSFTDQTYGNLKVDVSGTNPNLTVKIGWGADPYFDLRITPWSPPPWESPDIWIDSPVNGWDTYEYADAAANPGVPGNPVRNGDRPRIGRGNRVYARVTNEGNVAATNVRVSFVSSSPPGIGDTGNWALIDRVTLASIPAGATVIAGPIIWQPNAATHTCIKATMDVQTGELNANNNSAQENVGDFDATSASPWKPFVGNVQVSNPTPVHQSVRMDVTNLPKDWTAWVSDRTVELNAGETRMIRYKIDPGTGGNKEIGSRTDVSLVGRLLQGDRGIDLGGVTTAVHFVRASKTEIELGAREQELSAEAANALKITARVDPPVTGAPIALDVTDSQQRSIAILPARTAADGSATWVLGEFIARDLMPALRQGEKYSFQADFYGTANLESSSSPPVTISVR